MKNIVLILTQILFTSNIFAQSNYPCVNNVSTNPMAPSNYNLPQNQHPQVNLPELFLNYFNWLAITGSNTLGNLPTNTAVFDHLGPGENMFNLYSFQNHAYYDYLKADWIQPSSQNNTPGYYPDYTNGWELLLVNLGWFPNNSNGFISMNDILDEDDQAIFPNQHPTVPYVVFYHRYLSRIRVFANVGETWALEHAYDAVEVEISFDDTFDDKNGLLRGQNGYDSSLDVPSKVIRTGSICQAPNTKRGWFSVDFDIAYDPCVCDFASGLRIDFRLVKNTNFSLYGRSIGVSENIVDDNGNTVHGDFLSNYQLGTNGIAQGGFVIYQNMEKLVDDYIQQLNKHKAQLTLIGENNVRLEFFIAMMNYGKKVYQALNAGQTLGISTLVSSSVASGIAYFMPNLLTPDGKVKNNEGMRELELILFSGLRAFVSKDIKNIDTPKKPEKPKALFTEMFFKGKLEQTDFKFGPVFYTPGSYGNAINTDISDFHRYPIYNDALGVFALLESPKVEIALDTFNLSCSTAFEYDLGGCEDGQGAVFRDNHASIDKVFQIRLKEDLKYAINPKLNITDLNIDASFDVVLKLKEPDSPLTLFEGNIQNHAGEPMGSWDLVSNVRDFKIVTDPEQCVNFQSISANIVDNYDTLVRHPGYQGQWLNLHNDFVPISDSILQLLINSGQDSVFYTHNGYRGSYMTINTEFININEFKNNVAGFGYTTSYRFPERHNSPHPITCNQGVGYTHTPFNDCNELKQMLKGSNVPSIEIDSIILKLKVNVKYNDFHSDGEPHEYSYLYSYVVDSIHVNNGELIYDNLYNSIYNFSSIPNELNFDDANFNGSHVNGCVLLNSSTYVCRSRNKTTLTGDIYCSPGYNVIFLSEGEILMEPETEINGEIEMIIGSLYQFQNHPMPPANDGYVQDYCKGQNAKYKANLLRSDIQSYYDSISQANPAPQPEPAPIEFIVFPNPTTGASQAGLNLPELATVSISIVDITGKVQGRPVQNQVLPMGRNVLNLESEPLAPGVYFVQVVVNGEKLTQRLVKQ